MSVHKLVYVHVRITRVNAHLNGLKILSRKIHTELTCFKMTCTVLFPPFQNPDFQHLLPVGESDEDVFTTDASDAEEVWPSPHPGHYRFGRGDIRHQLCGIFVVCTGLPAPGRGG